MVKKKNKILLKFLLLFITIIMVTVNFEPTYIYAEINKDYGESGSQISDELLDSKNDDPNALVGLLSSFVLLVGRLISTIVAWMIKLIGATDATFPWADQIIFNAIPILDVNFINPSAGSFFLKSDGITMTTIGEIIRNIYFTGLSISLGFMGIVIGVLAIKLAISSIGSQKAKYKEAIVSWATALVLIFGMHFLISLLFYLNESLVKVASKIVIDASAESGMQISMSNGNVEVNGVVSGLGEYFLEKASEGVDDGDWFKAFKTRPVPAVLYLMFVFQSLTFLIAYFKRFFYVVILSMLAPYVVIYDFLSKSISL